MPARLRPFLLAPLVLALAGCGEGTGDATGGTAADGAGLQLVASFYPLEYLLERVAGDRATVDTLTAPGVEPHEVELSPRSVGSLGSADLVVYESGMQPAVDDAVGHQAADHSFDVAPAADLLPLGESSDEHGTAASGHDDHDHGPLDPHFWLDPQRYGAVATALGERLAELDPQHAQAYAADAAALVEDLDALDGELAAGLASCEVREVVTTHDAFGYLGARYDLHMTGITGLSPESEPSPARLAEVAALVDRLGVSTIYAEPLLPRAIAETVAEETGAQVLTLDPADGLSSAGSDADYFDIMRTNLATLREGQRCS
ncbi:metal ABC transporter substrate-binding protein [Ornithinimicrobium avium]|uniref:Zinc ABC transporter substrate-binding protein n=1 Tax=Ornithinimicrobium avium TaxID=2283195 RepID=A0A345NIX6_9MICO|nr:metal ABC transporter substrate-binding protein [Ornithinimicrobium avium]AXH94984.1 zinc ABC transporter substrate-binding protein [Ornithinimicrobium avium]